MELGGPPLPESALRRHIISLQNGALNPRPILLSANDISVWADRLGVAFMSQNIPRAQWSDAAILFLEGGNHRELYIAMRQRRQARLDLAATVWEWHDFLFALHEVLAELDVPSQFMSQAAKVAGTGLMVAGGVALAPMVAVAGLNVLGFTAAGVAAGSIAAGIQSIFYGGATAGLFSICQSVGATAAAPAIGSVVTAAGTVLAGAALRRQDGDENEGGDPDPEDGGEPLNGGIRNTNL